MNEHVPWIPFEATDWLKKKIYNGDIKTVFEYGAGESTLFFQDRVNQVVTVEHNETWFKRIKAQINPDVVKLILAPSFKTLHEKEIPTQYVSNMMPKFNFCDYVESINANEIKYDLVLIDGRARPGCIAAALSHINLGKYLLLDNSNRGQYRKAIDSFLLKFAPGYRFHGHGPIEKSAWSATVWRIL